MGKVIFILKLDRRLNIRDNGNRIYHKASIVSKQLSIILFVVLISACNPVSKQKTEQINPPLDPIAYQCIASQSQCDVTTDNAQYSIRFSQENLIDKIKGETPFSIYISALALSKTQHEESLTQLDDGSMSNVDKAITKITGHLEGRDMFMGKVPVFFSTSAQKLAIEPSVGALPRDNYLAEVVLANCMAEQMVWRFWLNVERGSTTDTFYIDFTSKH